MTEECAQEVLTPSVDRESILLSLDAWNTDGGGHCLMMHSETGHLTCSSS